MAPVKARFLGAFRLFQFSPPKLEDSQAGREETMNGNWNCSSSCLLSTVLTSFAKKWTSLIRWGWNEPLFAVLDFQSLCLISPALFPQSFVVLE